MVDELAAAGIPAYAELKGGYFEQTEVETVLSLLRAIDNPYQDIPLAGTLRSPIGGLDAEELAAVRLAAGSGPYFECGASRRGRPGRSADAALQAVRLPQPAGTVAG